MKAMKEKEVEIKKIIIWKSRV